MSYPKLKHDVTVRLDRVEHRLGRVEHGLVDLGKFMKTIALELTKSEGRRTSSAPTWKRRSTTESS